VTRVLCGPGCRPGIGLGSDDVTVACSLPSLCSVICLHIDLKASTFCVWIGSLKVGAPSGVPSECVHLVNAPGVACITSSGSGPARCEEKGTLKDRLRGPCRGAVCLPKAATSGRGCFEGGKTIPGMGGSGGCGGRGPKPIEGVILSQPWRALPVKLEILCMTDWMKYQPSRTTTRDGWTMKAVGNPGWPPNRRTMSGEE